MTGKEIQLIKFMSNPSDRFIIPVYQRKYDWKIENCKQLYNDLIRAAEPERKSHFFGSIVSSYKPHHEYLIIDGQQRLTTVSLLLLAMYHLLETGKMVATQNKLSRRIYAAIFDDIEGEIKLTPIDKDNEAFRKLFGTEPNDYVLYSNMTRNYQYFYDRIQKEELSIDDLYSAIKKLEIISIELTADDNPQLIFESLNSTGLDLSESDKIRNYILMGQDIKQQEYLYKNYWSVIEQRTGEMLTPFMRDYLSIKTQNISTMGRVYFTFKQFVEDQKISIELLLKELKSYAGWYQMLEKASTGNEKVDASIYRLNRLETTVARPFLLEVLRLHFDVHVDAPVILSWDDLITIFQTVEALVFRRQICDVPTNALNKLFLFLHREIIRFDKSTDNYVEKFCYALSAKKDKVRFPDDDEFAQAITERQVYKMNSKNKLYLLERLENAGTAETKDVYHHLDSGTYSIEHIMPQHLTPAWQKELGDDYEEIHDLWLHRLANLTLTAYNSKYSNSPFQTKRDMEHGFKQSGIKMNQLIAQKEHWTEAELAERNEYLRTQALKIWAYPVSSYVPPEKQMDSFGLDDDIDATGKDIVKFSFRNVEYPVTSWADMFEQVVKMLHAEDRSVLLSITHSDNELSPYISNHFKNHRNPLQIETNLFVEKNTSTNLKMSILQKLFKQYGTAESELFFFVREHSENTPTEEIARYALRRKYWSFAIPQIQAVHKGSGCFSGCSATKNNCISGSFGISGCGFNIISNYSSARVELYLSKPKKEDNKALYHYLYQQKNTIEAKMGTSLNWFEYPDMKSSYVTIAMKNVSITKESDWKQMAKFQTEWSLKFYEVFFPILKNYAK